MAFSAKDNSEQQDQLLKKTTRKCEWFLILNLEFTIA